MSHCRLDGQVIGLQGRSEGLEFLDVGRHGLMNPSSEQVSLGTTRWRLPWMYTTATDQDPVKAVENLDQ